MSRSQVADAPAGDPRTCSDRLVPKIAVRSGRNLALAFHFHMGLQNGGRPSVQERITEELWP